MSRYIDADALGERLKGERDFYKKMYDCMQQPCEQDERAIIGAYYTAYSKSYHIVKDAPTVDAVPVRCKDCKWFKSGIDIDGKPFTKCIGANGSVRTYGHTAPDWFCADGERIR